LDGQDSREATRCKIVLYTSAWAIVVWWLCTKLDFFFGDFLLHQGKRKLPAGGSEE
jgi:hypothetical protein